MRSAMSEIGMRHTLVKYNTSKSSCRCCSVPHGAAESRSDWHNQNGNNCRGNNRCQSGNHAGAPAAVIGKHGDWQYRRRAARGDTCWTAIGTTRAPSHARQERRSAGMSWFFFLLLQDGADRTVFKASSSSSPAGTDSLPAAPLAFGDAHRTWITGRGRRDLQAAVLLPPLSTLLKLVFFLERLSEMLRSDQTGFYKRLPRRPRALKHAGQVSIKRL